MHWRATISRRLAGAMAAPAMAFLLLFAARGFSATFTATLDRNAVTVGESVTLSLTLNGAENAVSPTLPPLPNLTMTSSGQSQQLVINGGQRSMQFTYTYQLTATQPGDVVIPSIQGRAGGAVLTTQPLALKILPQDPAARAAQTNLAFIRLVPSKTEVYVGEAFPVEMHLYWQNAKDGTVNIPQLKGDGFLFAQGPRPGQTRTQVGNALYNLAVCKLTATALRAGTLTLGPAESTMTLLIPRPGARPDFFGRISATEQVFTATSEAAPIRVLPLPRENVPPGFTGLIGTWSLHVTAGPTNLTVGDPITVRVQIAGNGPIESLQLPAQSDWRDFTTYPATAKTDLHDPLGLAGRKSFEQVVIPQNHEIKSLPPLRLSFFDPAAKAYRTLSGQAIPLNIRPAGVAAAPPPVLTNAASAAAPVADDIVHIRARLDSGPVAPLLALQPWFLGVQGVPVVLWLALLIRRKRAESLANNPRLRRQREVAARVRGLLNELRAHAAAQKSAEFFAALFRVLQEQLGERLDLPASAITEAVIDERLRGRGLSDDTLRALHELFQTCNAARYAPVHSSEELSALVPKLEGVLRALQGMKT